ncbi:MAG TPA: PAS domain-containing protein [Usitatibacter sp.]|nr:PAS domain-containing protein [Usitatibacter sp.]
MDVAAALLAGSPDGVLAFDRDCVYTLWNPAMERISGMAAGDVVGRKAPEVFPFLVETGEIEHFRAALRGERALSSEQRFRVPETGTWGFFDAHYFPVREGESIVGAVGVVRNVTGRHRNRVRAAAQVAVSRVLVGSDGADASARILSAIGEATEWDCGAYFEVDTQAQGLHCEFTWHLPDEAFAAYVQASAGSRFAPGEGLPGRCWAEGRATWIADIARDPLYSQSAMAARERLRSAVAFPIRVAGKVVGVMEFFSRRLAEPDPELLTLLEDLGAQFGQFVERRRVEDSFAESRAYFRAIFEQAPFTIQVFTPDGRCIDANPAFEKMWGVGREALAGYNLLADPQLEALGLMPLIRRAFAGESVALPAVTYDPARNRLPGRGRVTEASLYPVRGAEGTVGRVVLMHRDVTEQAQLARAEAAARLGLWEYDLATGRVQWSEGIYGLIGVAPSSVAPNAESWRELVLPDDVERVDRALGEIVARGGEFTTEFRIRRADGEVRWIASIGRVEGGPAPGAARLLGVNIDITARKLAEIARQRQLEEMHALLDTLPVGVLIAHDAQCSVITGNRVGNRLMRMGGGNISMTPEDGASPPAYRAFRDDIELPLAEFPLRRVLSGKPVENLDYHLRFADGSAVDVLVSAAALRDESGDIRGAVATLLDVTEQKRARQALQEEDRRKTAFLATLAHELRNPLAPIRNAVEILRLRDAPPEVRSVCAIIERQMRHMVRLVDDLLDVSRITRGRLELRREPVTLQAIVAQAVEGARPFIEREGHALEVSLPEGECHLHGDAVRLVQAVLNLLNNAAKYTPPGGRIGLEVIVGHREASIRVRDSGIGMTPEQLERAFDMFWQAGESMQRSQGGMGIGLSLARTVVEMHGGRIAARSDGPGRGSEFEISLPLR